jgi:hypothetical protein
MPLISLASSPVRRGPLGGVAPPGGTWTPVFTTSWGYATGTSADAMSDNGTLDTLNSDYNLSGEVITAPGGVGWVATNVLRSESDATGTRNGWLELKRTTLGEIAEDEVRNFRVGFASYYPPAQIDNSQHGIQDGVPSMAGSNQNWNLTSGTNFTGEWQPSILIINNSNWRYYLESTVTPTRLLKEVKYTFDLQMQRGSGGNSNAFQFRAWVYDSAGVEIYGPSDWLSSLGSEPMSTTRWHTFNNRPGTAAVGYGCNGMDGTWPLHMGDWSEAAVVSSLDNPSLTLGTSIGPYGSCTGE